MFQPSDFATLQETLEKLFSSTSFVKYNAQHAPKMENASLVILPSSQPKQLSPGEVALNWQIENALAQNELLI